MESTEEEVNIRKTFELYTKLFGSRAILFRIYTIPDRGPKPSQGGTGVNLLKLRY